VRIALPVLPEAVRTWPRCSCAPPIAIIYGSLCCLAQRDVKRLIAYSSVGHMGFVMLGIATLTPTGINAAVFGMVAHGVITGMLFFLAGSMHERYHTRDIVELGGGMATLMPRLAGVFTLACIASWACPGWPGFWGDPGPAGRLEPGPGAVGAAVHPGPGRPGGHADGRLLPLAHPAGQPGPGPRRWGGKALGDLAPLEVAAWSPLIVLMVALGFAPGLILWLTNPSVTGWFTELFALART
jgi:NADH-quinone oxidoreductase subunit M